MLISIITIVAGLMLLLWSADKFVEGAAAVAKSLGLSTLLIGMIVVGFGTSAPELAVSAISAYHGNPGIALGNAYGSNIANIALVLGLTAVISPVAIQKTVLRKEIPLLLGITVLALWHLHDGQLSRNEGISEIIILVGAFIWLVFSSQSIFEEEEVPEMTSGMAWVWLAFGFTLLVVSSRMLVWGAVNIAHAFGVSDLVIGLTVVAVGTSLPELAASAVAAKKGKHDLVVGNVIGSNLFNTFAVVGLAGAIHPLAVPDEVISRDWLVMVALTLLVYFIGKWQKNKPKQEISRFAGATMLCVYTAYTVYLITSYLS